VALSRARVKLHLDAKAVGWVEVTVNHKAGSPPIRSHIKLVPK
jgi:hypothetical protein